MRNAGIAASRRRHEMLRISKGKVSAGRGVGRGKPDFAERRRFHSRTLTVIPAKPVPGSDRGAGIHKGSKGDFVGACRARDQRKSVKSPKS